MGLLTAVHIQCTIYGFWSKRFQKFSYMYKSLSFELYVYDNYINVFCFFWKLNKVQRLFCLSVTSVIKARPQASLEII